MKHTPGPWRLGTSGGSVVADHPVPEMSDSDSVEYYGGHLIAESITLYNARLIAAAPELLDALQEAKHMFAGEYPGHPTTERIFAAIEKATGESA